MRPDWRASRIVTDFPHGREPSLLAQPIRAFAVARLDSCRIKNAAYICHEPHRARRDHEFHAPHSNHALHSNHAPHSNRADWLARHRRAGRRGHVSARREWRSRDERDPRSFLHRARWRRRARLHRRGLRLVGCWSIKQWCMDHHDFAFVLRQRQPLSPRRRRHHYFPREQQPSRCDPRLHRCVVRLRHQLCGAVVGSLARQTHRAAEPQAPHRDLSRARSGGG